MTRHPLLSVVIPSYNRRAEVLGCIEALTIQTELAFEVVVVDDGSVDDTPHAVRAFADGVTTPAISCVELGGNRGANVARNRGTREATADIVAFLDSDCIPDRDWVEEVLKPFSDPRVTAVAGRLSNPEPRNIWEAAFAGTNRIPPGDEARRIVSSNLAVRKDVLLQQPFDEDLRHACNEEGLFLRLRALRHRIVFAPRAHVIHAHRYERASYLRRGAALGRGAADLVYKYRLPPRLDLLPFILAYATAFLAILQPALIWLGGAFWLAGVCALAYAEMHLKGKSLSRALFVLPAQLLFYHNKLFSYVVETIRLWSGRVSIERVRLPR